MQLLDLPSDPVLLAFLHLGIKLKRRKARRLRELWTYPELHPGFSTGKTALLAGEFERLAFNRLSRKQRRKRLNRARKHLLREDQQPEG